MAGMTQHEKTTKRLEGWLGMRWWMFDYGERSLLMDFMTGENLRGQRWNELRRSRSVWQDDLVVETTAAVFS